MSFLDKLFSFEPSAESIAQLAHFAWGAWPILALHHLRVPLWVCLLGSLVYINFKEFVIDLKYHKDPLKEDLKDFGIWCVGIVVAVVICYL